MKKLNNNYFTRPLLVCACITAGVAAIQYLFDGKINEQVLNHVVPVSIVAYFYGLHFGRREQVEIKKI